MQKLGIKPGFCISASDAPSAYADIVGKLPADVTIVPHLAGRVDMVHPFSTKAAGLVDDIWAGLKFVIPKARRGKRQG